MQCCRQRHPNQLPEKAQDTDRNPAQLKQDLIDSHTMLPHLQWSYVIVAAWTWRVTQQPEKVMVTGMGTWPWVWVQVHVHGYGYGYMSMGTGTGPACDKVMGTGTRPWVRVWVRVLHVQVWCMLCNKVTLATRWLTLCYTCRGGYDSLVSLLLHKYRVPYCRPINNQHNLTNNHACPITWQICEFIIWPSLAELNQLIWESLLFWEKKYWFKTKNKEIHKIFSWMFISHLNLFFFLENHKKCFSICWPILIIWQSYMLAVHQTSTWNFEILSKNKYLC